MARWIFYWLLSKSFNTCRYNDLENPMTQTMTPEVNRCDGISCDDFRYTGYVRGYKNGLDEAAKIARKFPKANRQDLFEDIEKSILALKEQAP